MAQLAIPLAIASTAITAIGQVQAGKAQAQGYRFQAEQELLKGKQASIQYQQQGLEVLRKIRENLASVNARAGTGSIDPFSGSPQSLKNYAAATGAEEYYLTAENARLQEVTSEINSAQYIGAAKQAERQGWINAIGTIGQSAMTMSAMGGAPAGSTTSALPGSAGGNASRGFVTGGW